MLDRITMNLILYVYEKPNTNSCAKPVLWLLPALGHQVGERKLRCWRKQSLSGFSFPFPFFLKSKKQVVLWNMDLTRMVMECKRIQTRPFLPCLKKMFLFTVVEGFKIATHKAHKPIMDSILNSRDDTSLTSA